MGDVFDSMGQGLRRQFARQKEHLEERGRLTPPEAADLAWRAVFGSLVRACITYQRTNMTFLARRLELNPERVRRVLNGEEVDDALLEVIVRDEVLGVRAWLDELCDGRDWFIERLDELAGG